MSVMVLAGTPIVNFVQSPVISNWALVVAPGVELGL